jgi:molybdenum cofactor cytidylyltransferase
MTAFADIAIVVLAAGMSTRFGSDKLMVQLEGIPLGLHIGKTISPMGFGWRYVICGADSALSAHYAALGFTIIPNDRAEAGQAHSLHLAVQAVSATPASALMVTLADMPFVPATHIDRVARTGVLACSYNGNAVMPPALFPRDSWPDLLTTSGDRGAAPLLKSALKIETASNVLRDIDTSADLPASK